MFKTKSVFNGDVFDENDDLYHAIDFDDDENDYVDDVNDYAIDDVSDGYIWMLHDVRLCGVLSQILVLVLVQVQVLGPSLLVLSL